MITFSVANNNLGCLHIRWGPSVMYSFPISWLLRYDMLTFSEVRLSIYGYWYSFTPNPVISLVKSKIGAPLSVGSYSKYGSYCFQSDHCLLTEAEHTGTAVSEWRTIVFLTCLHKMSNVYVVTLYFCVIIAPIDRYDVLLILMIGIFVYSHYCLNISNLTERLRENQANPAYVTGWSDTDFLHTGIFCTFYITILVG